MDDQWWVFNYVSRDQTKHGGYLDILMISVLKLWLCSFHLLKSGTPH